MCRASQLGFNAIVPRAGPAANTRRDRQETRVNEYVVIVQMKLTGPTTEQFASLHEARDFAEKPSAACPAVTWTDVRQSFDGMAPGPDVSFERYSRGIEIAPVG